MVFFVNSSDYVVHIEIYYWCAPLKHTWWCHQMETISTLLAIWTGNSPVPGEFPTQRPVMRSFDVFFDLRLNKWLSKQSWGWWFEMLSCPLWHCNVAFIHEHLFLFFLFQVSPNPIEYHGLNGIRTLINNCINIFVWNVFTHPCFKFSGSAIVVRVWVSHCLIWVITYPCHNINDGLLLLLLGHHI